MTKVFVEAFFPSLEIRKKSDRFLSVLTLDNALAAFGTAGVEDFTAGDSCHARAEAVAAFADYVAGLECTFH